MTLSQTDVDAVRDILARASIVQLRTIRQWAKSEIENRDQLEGPDRGATIRD